MPHDHDPRQWEEAIGTFEAADARKVRPEHPVVFVGSSSIRFWRLKKFFREHHKQCLNRGFGGSGLNDLLHYFERIVGCYNPRALVLYSGENDLGHGASPEAVIDLFQQVITRVDTELPGTPLLILPIKPSPALWGRWPDMERVNAWIAETAVQAPHVDTVDTATVLLGASGEPDPRFYMRDQLHLSQEAYQAWSDLVRPWLCKRV